MSKPSNIPNFSIEALKENLNNYRKSLNQLVSKGNLSKVGKNFRPSSLSVSAKAESDATTAFRQLDALVQELIAKAQQHNMLMIKGHFLSFGSTEEHDLYNKLQKTYAKYGKLLTLLENKRGGAEKIENQEKILNAITTAISQLKRHSEQNQDNKPKLKPS